MLRVALCAAAVLLGASAQTLTAGTIVGTADAGNCYPFTCNDSGTNFGETFQYQQVYSASNFSGPTTILSESFYQIFARQYGGRQVILGGSYEGFLSTTPAPVDGLSYSCIACNLGPDNKEVFDFTIPAGGEPIPASGVFTISNNISSFVFNPSAGNLLLYIIVRTQDTVPNGTGNSYMDADNSGVLTSRAYAFIYLPYGYVDSVGLVTGFGTSPSPAPEPSSLLLVGSGVVGLAGALRRKRSGC